MNIMELVKKLDKIGVPKRYYSVDGCLLPDTYILNKVYEKWEFFYFDERGNRNNHKTFSNESDACEYMLGVLENEMEY